MVPDQQDLFVQEIREKIHALRLDTFTALDQDVRSQLEERIKVLPTPEALEKLFADTGTFKKLVQEVGEIMRLKEIYSRRDKESKIRFLTKKKMPPRYKVLDYKPSTFKEKYDWTKNKVLKNPAGEDMQYDKAAIKINEMVKLASHKTQAGINETIMGLISISDSSDKNGFSIIADAALNCAKQAKRIKEAQTATPPPTPAPAQNTQNTQNTETAPKEDFADKIKTLETQFSTVAKSLSSLLKDMYALYQGLNKAGMKEDASRASYLYNIMYKAGQTWNSVIDEMEKQRDAVKQETLEQPKTTPSETMPAPSPAPSPATTPATTPAAASSTTPAAAQTPKAFNPNDVKSMSRPLINSALNYIKGLISNQQPKVALKTQTFNKTAAQQLPQELIAYIDSIKNDPAKLNAYVAQLQAQLTGIASIKPTNQPQPQPATPAKMTQDQINKSLEQAKQQGAPPGTTPSSGVNGLRSRTTYPSSKPEQDKATQEKADKTRQQAIDSNKRYDKYFPGKARKLPTATPKAAGIAKTQYDFPIVQG